MRSRCIAIHGQLLASLVGASDIFRFLFESEKIYFLDIRAVSDVYRLLFGSEKIYYLDIGAVSEFSKCPLGGIMVDWILAEEQRSSQDRNRKFPMQEGIEIKKHGSFYSPIEFSFFPFIASRFGFFAPSVRCAVFGFASTSCTSSGVSCSS